LKCLAWHALVRELLLSAEIGLRVCVWHAGCVWVGP
jgi:hypothetical protein